MEADATERLFFSYYQMSKVCAEEVMKRLKDEEQREYLGQLEKAVRQVSELENETRKDAHTFDAIEKDAKNSDDNKWGNLSKIFKVKRAKVKNVSDSEGLEEFQKHIETIQENLELADMIVASSDNNIDPYSKQPIEHPVKSKFCSHVFDKTAVMQILKTKGANKSLWCPIVGCSKKFTAKDLVDINIDDTKIENDEELSD